MCLGRRSAIFHHFISMAAAERGCHSTSFGKCRGAKGTVTAFSPSFKLGKENGRDKNEIAPILKQT